MRILRISILSALLISLVFVGVGLGTGACGGTSGLQGTIDTGTGYEGPVALPVTIAKDVGGLDGTTLAFLEDIDANKVGTITFNTINRTPTCQTVYVYVDGALVDTLTTISDDCGYTYDVTLAQVDTPIAFTAQDTDSLDCSEPTITQITDTTGLYDQDIEGLPQYIMQVSVTNMSTSTSTATADIGLTRPASLSTTARRFVREETLERSIIFTAEASDGSFYLYQLPVVGGTTAELFSTTALPSLPLGLHDTADNMIYFLDPDGLFYSLTSDATTLENTLLNALIPPSESESLDLSFFSINSNGDYIVYVGEFNDGLVPVLGGIGTDSEQLPCIIESEEVWVANAMEVAFAAEDTILVIARTTEGSYRSYNFSLSEAIESQEGNQYRVQVNDYVESANYLGNPVTGTDPSGYPYLLCAGDDGVINICRETNRGLETVVAQGVDVVAGSVSVSYESTYLLFSLETDPVVSCYHFFESEETSCRILGSHPMPLHTDEGEVVGYISTVNDYPQIAIENPDNTGE